MKHENKNENPVPSRNLTYADSQEPDQMTQTDALNAVDRFLSFEEEKENTMYTGILHNGSTGMVTEPNSEQNLNLSAKVVKYLCNRKEEDMYSVRKMGVFNWDDPFLEEGHNCNSYDVGPATQMAAEVLEELFTGSSAHESENLPNKTEEIITDSGNEMKGNDEGLCVFRHPKRKRSMLSKTLRRSVLCGVEFGGCASNRLAVIMDSVKRKKRSPVVKFHKTRHGNFRVYKGVECEEKDKVGRLRERFDRRVRAIRVDAIAAMSFLNERRNISRARTVRVLFSKNLDLKVVRKQKKILSRFGSSTASSISDATHFVADRFSRTKNMLEAIAMGRYVVTHDYLENCAKAGDIDIVSEEEYVLRDFKKEREIGFSMPESLLRAKEFPLLKGWKVSITPNARPNKEILKCLVKASHGQLVERLSRNTMENEDTLRGNFFIISCKEDYHICSPLLDLGINAYDSELLLNGIVTQKLEFERHCLFSGRS